MYHVDGNFVYRQRETNNRHTKQVARAYKRFHPRDRFLPQFLYRALRQLDFYGTRSSVHRGLRGFFFKKERIGNVMIGRDQLIGKHAGPRPRGHSLELFTIVFHELNINMTANCNCIDLSWIL